MFCKHKLRGWIFMSQNECQVMLCSASAFKDKLEAEIGIAGKFPHVCQHDQRLRQLHVVSKHLQTQCISKKMMKANSVYVSYVSHIYIWVRVKIHSMDQGPGPTHDPYSMIHTPIHTSLCNAIHTPRSIPHLSMVYSVLLLSCYVSIL